MISAQDVVSTEHTVALLGLAAGLVLGWIARYSNFCTLGAISDWYASQDMSRLRMWLLAIAVAMAGTQFLIATQAINVKDSFYIAPRLLWLSNIAGGLIFGFGMVLASGCGSRTLVRIGGGNLKSIVVFVVLAVSAIMTMRGLFAVMRTESVDQAAIALGTKQDLSSLLGLSPAIMAGVIVTALLITVFSSRSFLQRPRLIAGGLVIGLMVVAGWYITGHIGFIAEDPSTLEPRFLATNTRGIESLTFVAPLAYWLDLLMLWSDKSRTITFGIATVSGVVLGSMVHALATRSFRLEGFHNRQDLSRHLVGAALMGMGGVTAMGCTIGQGITGLSLLALGSVLTTISIVCGVWAGLRWVERRA